MFVPNVQTKTVQKTCANRRDRLLSIYKESVFQKFAINLITERYLVVLGSRCWHTQAFKPIIVILYNYCPTLPHHRANKIQWK